LPQKRLALLGSIARTITAAALFVFPITASFHLETGAVAQDRFPAEAPDRLAKFIEEASIRFAVSVHWIRAVIRVESAGDEHAISPRGAMGLMQLMSATWVELSARHGLGLDPFDANDNILVGTAYLKVMHDRSGSAGFLAAYHAGPARYEQHLATGQPLPPETIAYVTAVTSLLTEEQGGHTVSRNRRTLSWRESPLFIERVNEP
jgi:soluble lytic murein transglycosylase-like protein